MGSYRALIVGDVHATPQELGDCRALADLVYDTAQRTAPQCVLFLGDLYNTHSVVNTPTIDFWCQLFDRLDPLLVLALVGNHDAYSPTIQDPHALIIHKTQPNVDVLDAPLRGVGHRFFVTLPYYADPAKFLEESIKLKENFPDIETLVCHQTFDGAKLQEGFYAKDAVNPVAVPFKNIISGHIHTQMTFDKVWYPGSPRWRNLSDANVDKYIYLVEFNSSGYQVLQSIPVTCCKRIYRFTDSEETPAVIEAGELYPNADVRVDIYGSQEYISKRMVELKAAYGARCRTFPTREKKAKLSEADGIMESFGKFSTNFTPPKGTEQSLLLKVANERLS